MVPPRGKGKVFLVALGLRFGQAGNSALVQAFLVGYIATVMLIVYSAITLMSAIVAPETRGRDLVQLEDAL